MFIYLLLSYLKLECYSSHLTFSAFIKPDSSCHKEETSKSGRIPYDLKLSIASLQLMFLFIHFIQHIFKCQQIVRWFLYIEIKKKYNYNNCLKIMFALREHNVLSESLLHLLLRLILRHMHTNLINVRSTYAS